MTQAPERPRERQPSQVPKRRRRASARVRIAQSLALAGLVASLVGALGPADALRTTYSWPGEALPAETPRSTWYTPLLLSRHRPEALSATIPCSLPRALPDAERPVTVLATARRPQRMGGLAMTREGNRLLLRVGESTLGRLALASGPGDGSCEYRLLFGDGRWSVEGGPQQLERVAVLASMPVVTGLFSGLDLRSTSTPPSIEVTTGVQAPRTTPVQSVAWVLAIVCIVAAFLLVAVERRPRPWELTRRALRGAARAARAVDLVVAVILLGWLVLAPAFWDDGWIVAKHRSFSTSGGFSTYYLSQAANAPLGYLLDWPQHWLSVSTSALVVHRLPALLCLAATWLLCRWILARVLGSTGGEGRIALWALATTFLVGAMAWGMTVRPEPEVALLVTGIVACALRFSERPTAAPLALAAILVSLAFTTHPAGLAGLAPLLVIAPSIVRWLRANVAVAATLFAASAGLLMVSVFIGSDIEQRRADAQLIAASGIYSDAQLDELRRYERLSESTTATPLRRASVGLMALAILAFLLRRRRQEDTASTFPAASLALALLLFIAIPSKLPWHFGVLLGLAAVAVAVEAVRLRREAAEARSWEARPFIALGVVVVITAWCWSFRNPWNTFDLRTLYWDLGFERAIALSTLAAALPFLLVGAMILVRRGQGRRSERRQVPWRVAAWSAPVLAVPLIVFTLAVLAADTAKTGSWSLARQNLGALRGDMGCGLADDLTVPVPSSAVALASSPSGETSSVAGWAPPPPTEGLPRYALGPTRQMSSRTPWFRLSPETGVGLYVIGAPASGDVLELEWGRGGPDRIESLGQEAISPEFTFYSRPVRWRFVASDELPEPPEGATAVRIGLRNEAGVDTALAVTAPFTYTSEPLAPRLGQSGSATFVLPNLATYFPCAQQPRLGDGIIEVPDYVISPAGDSLAAGSPLRYPTTSPLAGLTDVYRLERLPVPSPVASDPHGALSVFEVDRRIPGAELAPPSVARVN